MKTIEELFNLHRAKSGLFVDYDLGDVAYIGNSREDNAVAGFVSPLTTDTVFNFVGIAVSAFGEATVQVPPFVACGRSGNGLVVLEPRAPMSKAELAYYAAYIQISVRWRFNWYRQVTIDRLRRISVPECAPAGLRFSVASCLPVADSAPRAEWNVTTRPYLLDELFELVPGHYHSLSALTAGPIPVISCGDGNNGIAGCYDVHDGLYQNMLTIALNGSPLATKYHPYKFAAKDDVAVCIPRIQMLAPTVLYIQTALERERWRYSYYRKCYVGKLKRVSLQLPTKDNGIDEDAIASLVGGSPYWRYVSQYFGAQQAQ